MTSPVRFFAVSLVALGLLLPWNNTGIAQTGSPLSISLATGGVAGVYFPLGGAMAQAWSQGIPNLTVTAESTGASVVNVRLIVNMRRGVPTVPAQTVQNGPTGPFAYVIKDDNTVERRAVEPQVEDAIADRP